MAKRPASQRGRVLLLRQRSFARDERGVTAVEFGLLALPFFAILGAILETSLVFLSGQVLDSAVYDVGRLIRTGQAQYANMTIDDFRSEVCVRTHGLLPNCDDGLHVEVQVINTFGELAITPPVDWHCDAALAGCNEWTRAQSYTPGHGGDIVVVQVYYKLPTIVPFDGLGLNSLPDGRRLMGAATVFRNEPFT